MWILFFPSHSIDGYFLPFENLGFLVFFLFFFLFLAGDELRFFVVKIFPLITLYCTCWSGDSFVLISISFSLSDLRYKWFVLGIASKFDQSIDFRSLIGTDWKLSTKNLLNSWAIISIDIIEFDRFEFRRCTKSDSADRHTTLVFFVVAYWNVEKIQIFIPQLRWYFAFFPTVGYPFRSRPLSECSRVVSRPRFSLFLTKSSPPDWFRPTSFLPIAARHILSQTSRLFLILNKLISMFFPMKAPFPRPSRYETMGAAEIESRNDHQWQHW